MNIASNLEGNICWQNGIRSKTEAVLRKTLQKTVDAIFGGNVQMVINGKHRQLQDYLVPVVQSVTELNEQKPKKN